MTSPFMQAALDEAKKAAGAGEVPVGAIIVKDGAIITSTHNLVEQDHDPTAHAEILAIREASRLLASPRLPNCDLYVTLEPCPMCAQAISIARIRRLYFGAYDPKSGGVDHGAKVFNAPSCHHTPEIYGGISEKPASKLLKQFFQGKRNNSIFS